MLIYGAGGHARVVLDLLRAAEVSVEAFVDERTDIDNIDGVPILHSYHGLSPMIIALGNAQARRRVAAEMDCPFGVAVHPTAWVSPSATLAEGTVVMAGAIIQYGTRIGRHSIVNTRACVDHDCVLGEFVHVAPGATLCGRITVGDGTWIGAGATVKDGVRIGANCTIGAGATVVNDIPDNTLAVGTPARARRAQT